MDEYQEQRSRTVIWNDPAPALRALQTMSGIAHLKVMQAGELPPPPVVSLIGMALADVSEGRVVFSAEPAEYHYNPLGTVHSGHYLLSVGANI
jgi:hypothetical protein